MAKILIVDDDRDVVDSCRLFLEKEGHEVFSAHNRTDGMEQVDEIKPDLLLLDVMMDQPDDGIAMAQDLRRKGFGTPILMLTSIGKATGMSFGRDDAIVPVDAFEEKPVSPAKLISTVNELLGKKEE